MNSCESAELTNEQLETFRKNAIRYARHRGYESHAEDFAQEVLIAALKVKREPYLEWVFSNYLRHELGDLRSENGREKSKDRRFGLSLDAPFKNDEGDEVSWHDIRANETVEAPDDVPWPLHASRFLTLKDAIVYDLVTGEDMDRRDVATLLGVNATRVSQRLTRATRDISRGLAREKFHELRSTEMEISWITL